MPVNEFENLIIQINKSTNVTSAYLLKYISENPISDNSFVNNIFQGSQTIQPIDYNINQSKFSDDQWCYTVSRWICFGEGHHTQESACSPQWGYMQTSEVCRTTGGDSGLPNDPYTSPPNNPTYNGGGGVSQPINTSTVPPCTTCPTLSEDPCEKIQSLNTKFPGLKQSLVDLAATTSQTTENGTFINNTATSTTPNPIQSFPAGSGTGGSIIINMNPTEPYTMIAHTHDASGSAGLGTYSIFSWDDLAVINKLIKNNHIDNSQFVLYVITADGTRYAVTIDKPSKLSNFFYDPSNLPIGTQIDMPKMLDMQQKFDTYYNPKTKGLITAISNPTDDKANFLKFMKEANLGVSLFEVDATFTNYQKLSISNSGVVTPAPPCN